MTLTTPVRSVVIVIKGGKIKQMKRKDGALGEWRVLSENNARNCKVQNWRTLQLHLVNRCPTLRALRSEYKSSEKRRNTSG
ncbi:hypothetical protein GBA52_016047 [Prunus armeniaca]|nr:hypothetical protein GBA52_016047 [Prunus armeniaca]